MTGQLGVEPSSFEGLRKWAWEASDGVATKNLAAWRLERWGKDALVQPSCLGQGGPSGTLGATKAEESGAGWP